MTATGALIARHVADLFPTQTSRFDLAQAARRGVISPLRCLRIPPGPGVRTIAKVPLRKGEVDQDFDQEELAALLDQEPVQRRDRRPLQVALPQDPGRPLHRRRPARQERRQSASATPGSTPRRSPARRRSASWPRSSPASSAATVDVLCNAMLLAEGWNSPAGDDLHAPRPDRLAADLPAAGRPRHPARAGQGGGPGDRLRPPGDDPRRDDRHPAQPARPRRLPRRRDRRRAGAARPRPQGPGRAPDRPRLRRRGEADGGARTGDLADRGREPRLPRAARLGGAGRRPGQHRRAGAGRGRCCRTTAPKSCAAASC